jgi:hypothetical protein
MMESCRHDYKPRCSVVRYVYRRAGLCAGVSIGEIIMTTLTVKSRPLTLTVPGEAAPTYAYDWYVDSVNGNDAWTGGAPNQPFATIAKLLTVLGAGDSVALAKGSTWREQLTIPANSVTVVAYGSGEAPILDCRDVVLNASFTKTVGQTNVYQVALSPDLAASGTWNSVWQDSVRLVRATSIANCDATPGSYYPSSDTTAPITMYVHASDSSNPGASGKIYRYAKRQLSVDSYNYSMCGINGIVGIGALSESGCFKIGISSILYGCEAIDGNKHNLYVREGCWVESVTATNAYYAGGSTAMFVYNDNTPSGGGETFLNCIAQVTNGYRTGVEGFYGHYNVSGNFGTVLYDNCTCTNLGNGFNGAHANIVVRNCTTTNCDAGFSANAVATSFTITGSTISIPATTGSGGSIQTGCGPVIIDGCTFIVPGARVSQAAIQNAPNNVNLTLTNTHFKHLVYALFWYSGTGGTINVSGCDFDDIVRNYDTPSGGPAITSDYNRFREAGQDFNIQGTLYGTVAAYQAATGQDAHSTIG